jgi:hypothetical protein
MSTDTESRQPMVLAYANPLTEPPLGGRLLLGRDEKGITLTDSVSCSTSPQLIRWMGVVLFVGGIVVSVLCWVGVVDRDHMVAALVAAVCGLPCILAAGRVKQRFCSVKIVSGHVYTRDALSHDWISSRFRPKRFGTVAASLDLRTGQFSQTVVVCYSLGLRCDLFTKLAPDEAKWAVHVMERAVQDTLV